MIIWPKPLQALSPRQIFETNNTLWGSSYPQLQAVGMAFSQFFPALQHYSKLFIKVLQLRSETDEECRSYWREMVSGVVSVHPGYPGHQCYYMLPATQARNVWNIIPAIGRHWIIHLFCRIAKDLDDWTNWQSFRKTYFPFHSIDYILRTFVLVCGQNKWAKC